MSDLPIERPEHDELFEDLDYMTPKEATARFYDELERLRTEVRSLRASNGEAALIAEHEDRIGVLEATAKRLSVTRTPFD